MAGLNEQEIALYNACEDYDCNDLWCHECSLYKKTGDGTGYCVLGFIIDVLQAKVESEG